MRYYKLLLAFLFPVIFALPSVAQEYTLSGYVRDKTDGETLLSATVYLRENGKGTVTNEYGFYSITVEQGTYTISVGYLGYEDLETTISLDQNRTLDFELGLGINELEEVVVSSEEVDQNVKDLQMSTNKLDIATIKSLPSLLGEIDAIKTIQLLPGVSSVGEGAAGFNVRGGTIDQNLVLLDEAPVYNSSHLFGFFSVFNPDAVKDVKLYKGGIPARYGGRLSSILDVRMKEGNNKQFEMNGGIGTIFSRLSIEAPIVKDKSSFIVAGRRSYIDVLAAPFLPEEQEGTVLNFYDLTLKSNYKFSEKDQVFLSGYFGRDNFGLGDEAGFNWGNSTLTARWNHLFNERLFANTTFYYSNYDYKIEFGDTSTDNFDWKAKIINYSGKVGLSYYFHPENVLRFGGQSIFYEFQPANAIAITNDVKTDISLSHQHALESTAYIEHEISPVDRLTVNYGLRLSHFLYLGPRNVYNYGEAPRGIQRPLESVEFVEKGKSIEDFINLEPRLAINYSLNDASSIKASYQRTAQYIHLLSNTTASIPLDIWTPSTNNIDPQMADQIAVGYFRNFNNNRYEFSGEFYYKETHDIIDYIDGADLILNEFVEGQILNGDGRAYGMELLLQKKTGILSGWVSYTLSRSERLVAGINNNEWYPSRFDQTHSLSATAIYSLSERVSLSANFIFNSGTPTTFATTRYEQLGYVIPNNDENARNNVRIPDYHRLDISLTLDPKKHEKRWKGQWVFGVYNLYNRRNPFSIYFEQQEPRVAPGSEVSTQATRLSVIGNFIPAISYNFTF